MTESERPSSELSPGSRLGRFELCSLIGKGGMGEVYLARDLDLGRQVALKFLPSDVAADQRRMQRFLTEARIVSALNHPNILTIYEVGEAAGMRFIATEYVEGQTLRQQIENGPLEVRKVIDVSLQTANALAVAHSAGIVHRDIKPENIMLRKDGIVKVLDFGLAKLNQKSNTVWSQGDTLVNTEPGLLLGTISYMSPEQARGLEIDPRSDIFSLGVVLYELLAGCSPFARETTGDVLVSILERDPPPLLVAPEIDAVVQRALLKDRELRYQTAAELVADLQQLMKLRDSDLGKGINASGASIGSQDQATPATVEATLPGRLSNRGRTSGRQVGSSNLSTAPEIAHVLFMDIVEYTKNLTHSQHQVIEYVNTVVRDTEAFRRARADNQLIRRATGDGMALVFFGDPGAPVRCALQISAALKSKTDIRLRMGVHSGIVFRTINIADEEDVNGRGINIAQRVMDCGDAGHILLSKEMVDYLQEVGDWEEHLQDLGIVPVKHDAQIHLFNLLVDDLGNAEVPSKVRAGVKVRKRPAKKKEAGVSAPARKQSRNSSGARAATHRSVASGSIKSLAILPLINAGDDPEMEYLSDGITESIINGLARLPQVRVMARATVFRYKGKDVDPMEAGRQLGVQAVMYGKLFHIGSGLVLRTELVNMSDGSQIWGEQYRRQISDIFELQEEISKTISDKLRLKLTGEDEDQLRRRYTENVEAYQLYLKGRYFWNKRTKDGLKKGSEYFKQAIDVDPSYALAYAGLADAYAFLGLHRVIPPHDILPKARAAAVQALKIDETLAEGHGALAYIKTIYDWDWSGAEEDFKRSLELNHRDPPTRSYYANYLAAMGRHDEAMAAITRAQELDPLSPIINVMVGYMAFLKRDYDLAVEQCLKTFELDPNFFWIQMGLGWVYEQRGMMEQAISQFQRAVEITNGTMGTLAGLGHAFGLAGRRAEALEIIERLKDTSQQSYVVPYDIALVYAGLRQPEEALFWLGEAYMGRFGWLIWINVEPKWDFLRNEPRFQQLLQNIGFDTQVKVT